MFGGLYPEGTGGPVPDLLTDLTLEKIDYDWIKEQKKPSFLKKAIKLIEEDGNYFTDLKEACITKLKELDPSKAPKVFNNVVDENEKRKIGQDIDSWEKEVREKEEKQRAIQKIFEMDDSSETSGNQESESEARRNRAENEKNKGNEALKSKDFKEAITYYTKSIEYDGSLAASYCNRALAYLKLKEYEKVVSDCNLALSIDPNYIKAYHRRGKAKFAQNKIYEAYSDFKFIMDKEPNNNEVNGDLKECQDLLKEQTQPEKGFKRVQIVEEEDDEEEAESENPANTEDIPASNSNASAAITAERRKRYDVLIGEIEKEKEVASAKIKDGLFDQATEILRLCIGKITSLGAFSESKEDTNDFKRKKAAYLNNIALCFKQIDDNKSVISYADQVIEMKSSLASDVLAKAYLRRGMAYERLEKYNRSMRDFNKVKHLEPGNLQASQGIRRVQPCCQYDKEVLPAEVEEEEEEVQETKSEEKIVEIEEGETILIKKIPSDAPAETVKSAGNQADRLAELTAQKNEGNALFAAKDIEGALAKFSAVSQSIEVNFTKQLNAKHAETVQLYLQTLSNQSLCLLQLNRLEETVKCSTAALYYQEDNIKCLYRRSQALRALGDAVGENTVETLKVKYDKYERARKDLEKVNMIDPKSSQAKAFLQETSKLAIQVKLALRQLENEKPSEKSEQTSQSSNAKQEGVAAAATASESNQVTQNLTAKDLNALAEKALQSATDQLVSDFKLPESSMSFERDLNQLKTSSAKQYAYIKQIPGDHYAKIYDKNDMPSQVFLTIVRALREYGAEDAKEMCGQTVRGLTQTAKFNLCMKFITKREKFEIREFLDSIELGSDEGLIQIMKL